MKQQPTTPEQTIDALTFRLLCAANATRHSSVPDLIEEAASLLKAIKAKEAELGIGVRVEGG